MFSKKSTEAPQTQAPRPANNRAMSSPSFSVFGSDIQIKGDVTAQSDLHIDGRIEGDIDCAALVQGETSEIVGAIRAKSARLAGIVRGTITADELVILKSARIEGDVTYTELSIEPGAQVDGRFAVRENRPTLAAVPSDPAVSIASAAS